MTGFVLQGHIFKHALSVKHSVVVVVVVVSGLFSMYHACYIILLMCYTNKINFNLNLKSTRSRHELNSCNLQ